MENQNKNSSVALILEDSRLIVNRKQLINKSQYFASLLSENYIDHLQQEHVINYNIPVSTLKDYISWIHDEKFCIKFDLICKTSLEKYCNRNSYEDLLKLLHLSVLFATDRLTEEIIIIIEATLLIPEFLIDIWLVAMDLGLSTLQDTFFAACLDYFEKLPIDKLVHLEKQNLMKLLNNANISSTKDYIQDIFFMWVKSNVNLSFEKEWLEKSEKPKILNCIVDYEKPQNHNSKIYLYCWDGKNFFKHSTLTYPKEVINAQQALVGMQFAGRRYDLYICGGEYGLGRGKFNDKIWRYSLISGKWFVDVHMPNPRRHMITVFFQSKLYLIGGVGRYRKQLNSIDIYDMHSRIWTKGRHIPIGFTKIPEYCVGDDKLIIYMTQLHILVYYSKEDTWTYFKLLNEKTLCQEVILMGLDKTACFIDVINKDSSDNMVVRFIKYKNSLDKCHNSNINYTCENNSVLFGPVLKLGCAEDICKIETYMMQCTDNNIYVWLSERPLAYYTRLNFHIHTVPIQESIKFNSLFSSFSSTTRKFFHIMDPAYLYSESKISIVTKEASPL